MSDDQLDNDLRNRIKQVFDDYHDDTAAEGWALLREKYPVKKKDRAIFWWRMAGAAAVLLMLLNVFLWYMDDAVYRKKIASIHKTEQTDSLAMPDASAKLAQHDSSAPQKATSKSGVANAIITITKRPSIAAKSTIMSHADRSLTAQNKQQNLLLDSSSVSKPVSATTSTTADQPSAIVDNSKNTIGTNNAPLINKKETIANQQQSVVVSKSMQDLFNKEDKAKKNIETQQTTQSRVAFGVFAASYVNYAKGSQRQFNNGAGISSDIKLTDNLSLSTGVSIGQNSLAYSSTTQSLPVAMMPTNSKNFQVSANMLPLVVPASKNLNASLVNLDVPVNLKYTFNPQKNNTYVAAGLSSGTFINENYSTTYSYNTPDNTGTTQSQEVNHKAFDNFYFAQMLNVAFGVGYPLGRNQLIIEPFFKYPLGGLGDQHILFGSGGLNLKFNLNPGKRNK